MGRALVVVASIAVCFVLINSQSIAQASKQLETRAKKVATPQQESWKQVDQINKESDNTRARYQQSRQAGSQTVQKSGYNVKKTKVGTRSAYKKHPPKKQKGSSSNKKSQPRK